MWPIFWNYVDDRSPAPCFRYSNRQIAVALDIHECDLNAVWVR
jgi:hypothetical protein